MNKRIRHVAGFNNSRMKTVSLIILLITCNWSFSQTDSTDIKVRKMIEVLGTTERMKVVAANLFKLQEEQNPGLTESEYWQKLKADGFDYEELIEMLVPIYKKHLTIDEINEIIRFYSSPSGQALVKKSPAISTESMQVGVAWGEKINQRIREELENSKEIRFNSPISNCSELKNGKFKYWGTSDNEIIVTRKDNLQEELIDGILYKARIQWFGDCEYKLWKYQEDGNYDSSVPIVVSIYELTEAGYKYIYKKEDDTEYFEGELEIIE